MTQRFTLQRSTVFFLFKYYSLVEIIYLFIQFNKTKYFLWNKKNTGSNGVNEENANKGHK